MPSFGVHPAMKPHYRIPQGRHHDVEYEVYDATGRFPSLFKTFNEAAAYALIESVDDDIAIHIDVLAYSEAGARFWAGVHGIRQFEQLPPGVDVLARIEVRGDVLIGMVP